MTCDLCASWCPGIPHVLIDSGTRLCHACAQVATLDDPCKFCGNRVRAVDARPHERWETTLRVEHAWCAREHYAATAAAMTDDEIPPAWRTA